MGISTTLPQTLGKYEKGKPMVQLSVGFVGSLWILRGGIYIFGVYIH